MKYIEIGERHVNTSTLKGIWFEPWDGFEQRTSSELRKNPRYNNPRNTGNPFKISNKLYYERTDVSESFDEEKVHRTTIYTDEVKDLKTESELTGLSEKEVENVKSQLSENEDLTIIGYCVLKLAANPVFEFDTYEKVALITKKDGKETLIKKDEKGALITVYLGEAKWFCGKFPMNEVDGIMQKLTNKGFFRVGRFMVPIDIIYYIKTGPDGADVFTKLDRMKPYDDCVERNYHYNRGPETIKDDRPDKFVVKKYIEQTVKEFSDDQKSELLRLERFVKVGDYLINIEAGPVIKQHNGTFSFRFRGPTINIKPEGDLLEKEAKEFFEKLGIEYKL